MTELPPIKTSAVSVATGLEARDNLIWICGQWARLRARLHPMTTGEGLGIRTAPTSKPPLDLGISDLLFEIEQEARQLGHVLMDETEWYPRTSHMPGLLYDIAHHYGHWTTADDRTALAFCDWAHEYRGKVTRALDRPPSPEFIGLCANNQCNGDVYAKRGQAYGKCRSCGGQVEVRARRELIRELSLDWLLPRKHIPDALTLHGHNITKGTVHKWVQRGRLVARGGLYKVEDAVHVAGTDNRKKAS